MLVNKPHKQDIRKCPKCGHRGEFPRFVYPSLAELVSKEMRKWVLEFKIGDIEFCEEFGKRISADEVAELYERREKEVAEGKHKPKPAPKPRKKSDEE
jgi:hypothetical protein